MVRRSAAVWLLLALLPSSGAAAEFEGAGEAHVVGENMVAARRRAMDRAREDALAAAVATLIDSEQVTAHADKLRGSVYKRHQAYVRRYRVLEEGLDGRVFRVRVAVVIDSKRLLSDLRRLLGITAGGAEQGRPTVVLRVELQGAGGRTSLGDRLATWLEGRLAAAGFSTDRQGQGEPGGKLLLSAQVQVAAEAGVRGLGLAGARGQATVTLALRKSGSLVVQGSGTGWGVSAGLEPAQRMAAERALELATRPVLEAMQRQWTKGYHVVRVSGVASFDQVVAIRRFLVEKVPGVRRVLPRRLERGEVWFVVSGGSSREIVGQISGFDFQSFDLKLKSIDGGSVWLTVNSRAAAGG
jgi:hypothetical protein